MLSTGSVSRHAPGSSAPSRTSTPLPGVEQENVCSVNDVLEGAARPGKRVLLLDDLNGWWPASGTALHLAEQGHDVTVVTASDKPAEALDVSHLGPSTRERFAKLGVTVICGHALTRWAGTTATIANLYTGDARELAFDSLVLATTNTVDDTLAQRTRRRRNRGPHRRRHGRGTHREHGLLRRQDPRHEAVEPEDSA